MRKKPHPRDRMCDPFYIPLITTIETFVWHADNEAKGKGIELTDANIKSAFAKARSRLKGGEGKVSGDGDREKIIEKLVLSIASLPGDLKLVETKPDGSEERRPAPPSEIVKAIVTVEESLKQRRLKGPKSRGYLNYLRWFMRQLEKRTHRSG